jgi:predicted 3-demethylubiquinone-9 3-methyltransferase (glyoxalase superfamily)
MRVSAENVTPCLWFDHEAEEAAMFYTSIFRNSRIEKVARYGGEGFEVPISAWHHGRPDGAVMVVDFDIDGRTFTALNGGPVLRFSEAPSFQIQCETQEEIDYYWERLSEEGAAGQSGWITDRYGLSWRVVPRLLGEWLGPSDPAAAQRVAAALLRMNKPELEALRRAYRDAGEG